LKSPKVEIPVINLLNKCKRSSRNDVHFQRL
jgi:hypothetical protein